MAVKILNLIKKDIVLTAAIILAAFSMFLVPPDAEYLQYIDFSTLALLFSLMGVMTGFRRIGLFRRAGGRLFKYVRSSRQMEGFLILICFFSGMLITNDVALITFVPFAIELLMIAKMESRIIFVVVMQTVAANLGSMLLPVGNPQNIYIYTKAGCSISQFILTVLPYAALSLVLILAVVLLRKNEKIELNFLDDSEISMKKREPIVYFVLFLICLAAVLKAIPAWLPLVLVLVCLVTTDRAALRQIDYTLLITFVGFFIFVGNIGRIPFLNQALFSVFSGREVLISAGLSQIISNVPTALMLYNFTDNWDKLLIGVNIGGLGTLIASMASLISYKLIAAQQSVSKAKYIICFSCVNIVFLIVLAALNLIID